MEHLLWHKPRRILLAQEIEALPDAHLSKPQCLLILSRLFIKAGNPMEGKRLLIHALKLSREWRDDFGVAQTLWYLSDANRLLGLHEEGIQQVKEALKICEQLNDTIGQVRALHLLGWLLYEEEQLDAAERAASQSINLLRERVDQYRICQCHHLLGKIHSPKGEVEKAISHFEASLRMASSFGWYYGQFWIHCSCFSTMRGSTTRTLILNVPSHMRSMTRPSWLAQCISGLGFGIGNASSEKRSRRLCVLSMLLRRPGPRGIWRGAEPSFVVSKSWRGSRRPLLGEPNDTVCDCFVVGRHDLIPPLRTHHILQYRYHLRPPHFFLFESALSLVHFPHSHSHTLLRARYPPPAPEARQTGSSPLSQRTSLHLLSLVLAESVRHPLPSPSTIITSNSAPVVPTTNSPAATGSSLTRSLRRLSKVIGAGVEDPMDQISDLDSPATTPVLRG